MRHIDFESDGKKYRVRALFDIGLTRRAKIVEDKAKQTAIRNGRLTKAEAIKLAIGQGMWDEEREKKRARLQFDLDVGEIVLTKCAVPSDDERRIALEMREERRQLRELMGSINSLEQETAEAFASQARFDFLVASLTTESGTGRRVFRDAEDYRSRGDEPVAQLAGNAMAQLYGLTDPYNFEPEERVLRMSPDEAYAHMLKTIMEEAQEWLQ
jgi:hypothetical protein